MNKLLQIQDLDKSFAGVHAINHLSFDVYEGEILALIGPNGCGKSTCVNLIPAYIFRIAEKLSSTTSMSSIGKRFKSALGWGSAAPSNPQSPSPT